MVTSVSRRASRVELSIASSWRQVNASSSASRFSITNARRFITYSHTTSRLRHIAVVTLFPLPGLVVSLALALIPLHDPQRGVRANWTFFLHVWGVATAAMAGTLLQARAVASIHHADYSTCAVAAVAIIAAVAPHADTTALLYVPSFALQASQLTIYPLYSALFAITNEWQQLVLVAVFAASIDAVDRRDRVDRCNRYRAEYRAIQWHLNHPAILPRRELLGHAISVLSTQTPTIREHDLAGCGSHPPNLRTCFRISKPHRSAVVAVAPAVATVVRKQPARDRDKLVVAHALELLQSAESILLVEYLEVAVPCVNLCCVVVASQLPSAVYNPKLVDFHFDPKQLQSAAMSIVLYTLLQGLTFIGIFLVLRVRYRLSALALLAFVIVIETHMWSLQGKATGWLVVMLAFPVMHYGVDVTFQFDFTSRSSRY